MGSRLTRTITQSVRRKRDKRKVRSVSLKFGTLNVGTITRKSRELADILKRRKVDILCMQETRWKGRRARNIGGGYVVSEAMLSYFIMVWMEIEME